MDIMDIVWTILLLISVTFFWFIGLLGLPGNWLITISACIYALFVPEGHHQTLWWITVGALVVLSIVGETLELFASAHGVRRRGGSRLSAVLSFAGAIIGAIVGAVIGTSIVPIVGSIVGALLLASAGALLGAFLGEQSKGRNMEQSIKVGQAAFWARLVGTFAKLIVGCVMVVIVILALCLQWFGPELVGTR